MELPYSQDVYLALIDAYNRDHMAFVIVGVTICVACIVAAVLPAGGQPVLVKRLLLAGLAGCSVFVGAFHQLTLMASLNFMAPFYGGLWILQGAVLLWLAFSHRAAGLFEASVARRSIGIAMALCGTFLYPVVVYSVAGSTGIETPVPGTAPNPTALAIVGILLTLRGGPPVVTLIVPVLWAVITGATAYLLSFPIDYTVSMGLGLAVAVGLYARFNRTE